MSKLIDFFKIIGANSNPSDVELSQEEVIKNAADLTNEQKEILLECIQETNKAAKKIDIDTVVHSETRRGLASIKNRKMDKGTSNSNIKSNEDNIKDDEELIK